jgi:hypothetical protein
MLWTLAIHHLDFVARHGTGVDHFLEGTIHQYAYPKEFQEWLEAGAPGLPEAAFQDYLRDNPLDR